MSEEKIVGKDVETCSCKGLITSKTAIHSSIVCAADRQTWILIEGDRLIAEETTVLQGSLSLDETSFFFAAPAAAPTEGLARIYCESCQAGNHERCTSPGPSRETENDGGLAFFRLCCCHAPVPAAPVGPVQPTCSDCGRPEDSVYMIGGLAAGYCSRTQTPDYAPGLLECQRLAVAGLRAENAGLKKKHEDHLQEVRDRLLHLARGFAKGEEDKYVEMIESIVRSVLPTVQGTPLAKLLADERDELKAENAALAHKNLEQVKEIEVADAHIEAQAKSAATLREKLAEKEKTSSTSQFTFCIAICSGKAFPGHENEHWLCGKRIPCSEHPNPRAEGKTGPKDDRDLIVDHLRQVRDDLLAANKNLSERVKKLEDGIREHRDQKGDARCWLDDQQLYSLLGGTKANTALPSKEAFLSNCARYWECRQNPNDKYEGEQEQIKNLQKLLKESQEDEQDASLTGATLSKLLNKTANALKGKPVFPLGAHSWHDLPERVLELQEQLKEKQLTTEGMYKLGIRDSFNLLASRIEEDTALKELAEQVRSFGALIDNYNSLTKVDMEKAIQALERPEVKQFLKEEQEKQDGAQANRPKDAKSP